jgi:WD40 repeat protein
LDFFSSAVALDGNYVLIGARLDDTHGTNRGQAHLFDATTGSLLRTFSDPTPTTSDEFGISVAIDNNLILIGAPLDDINGANRGQAHLFDAITGNLLRTFIDPTPTSVDTFGERVAINGGRVLIGAPGDDTNGLNVGQAHLFDVTTGNLLWTFNDPTVTEEDLFGSSVALEGNHVLIGARRDNTLGDNVGQAHLFDATTGSLLHTFNDPTPTTQDEFGVSVALDGNHVLIGAFLDDSHGIDIGQTHLFDAISGNLLQTIDDPTATRDDRFGWSIAIDGERILIGALGDDTNGPNRGQAHLFEVPEPIVPSMLFGLSRRLKATQEAAQYVITSAREYPGRHAKDVGAFACLMKPCKLAHLEMIVDEAYEKAVTDMPFTEPAAHSPIKYLVHKG